MLTFSDLVKSIRISAGLTQQEFADRLGFSKMLIVMLENETRQPTRNFIEVLAKQLGVRPFSLTPFIFDLGKEDRDNLSSFEEKLILMGEKFQRKLIEKKASKLSKSAISSS